MSTSSIKAQQRLSPDAVPEHAYVVEKGIRRYVLVPVEEYEELMDVRWAEKAIRVLEDPNTKWIDYDEWRLQMAGEQIAAARKKAGLTQKQLAARLKVPQSQISRIERNPDRTTVRTLKRIAKALRVDVRSLVS